VLRPFKLLRFKGDMLDPASIGSGRTRGETLSLNDPDTGIDLEDTAVDADKDGDKGEDNRGDGIGVGENDDGGRVKGED